MKVDQGTRKSKNENQASGWAGDGRLPETESIPKLSSALPLISFFWGGVGGGGNGGEFLTFFLKCN